MGYLKSEGIYLVDPLDDKTNLKKSQPVKLLSVDGIRKALRFVIINMGTVPAGLYCKDILLFFYSTWILLQSSINNNFYTSNAGKVTTASHSQGIRFLSEVAGNWTIL